MSAPKRERYLGRRAERAEIVQWLRARETWTEQAITDNPNADRLKYVLTELKRVINLIQYLPERDIPRARKDRRA